VTHPVLDRVKEIGGAVFTDGNYNLNIVGIRTWRGAPNVFDDVLHVLYKERGQWVDRWWPITTDPGTYWLQHPMNRLGCAAVVADRQYRSVWRLGLHRGKYLALVQRGCNDIAVHRDDNLDTKVDYREDNIDIGNHAINCHRATTRSGGSVRVDKWSAGCQVFADPSDFDAFIRLCKKQQSERGFERFTYTLLSEWT
jgi:hypothetical protein